MRKFAVMACLALGLVVEPRVASATPIGTNECADNGSGAIESDIFADFDDGYSSLGASEGNLGGYLVGYTLLLNSGADLTTFESSDVAHILIIHDSLFELISNTAFNIAQFANAFIAAVGNP